MTGKRKRYSDESKAKVALEGLRGERTVEELGAKHGAHPTMITAWKKNARYNAPQWQGLAVIGLAGLARTNALTCPSSAIVSLLEELDGR